MKVFVEKEDLKNLLKDLAEYYTGDAFNYDRVIKNIDQLATYTNEKMCLICCDTCEYNNSAHTMGDMQSVTPCDFCRNFSRWSQKIKGGQNETY